MPSVSNSQQRLMGWVHAVQTGKAQHAPSKIKNIAKHINKTDALHFAQTSHTGLPEHVKKAFEYGFYKRAVQAILGPKATKITPLEEKPKAIKLTV